jgi:hypothetical protein
MAADLEIRLLENARNGIEFTDYDLIELAIE